MKLETIQIRDLSNGILQKIDCNLAPRNSVDFAYNLLFDKTLGRATVRGGTALVGEQLMDGKSCLGIFQYIKSDGTKILMAVFNDATDTNADVYKYT